MASDVKIRGHLATEQERIISALEADIAELHAALAVSKQLEEGKRAEADRLEERMIQLEKEAEQNQATIRTNENSEFYGTPFIIRYKTFIQLYVYMFSV
ncbi:unnamed protein product [Protopolystoma xenopodis]|uniref:Uncharacterized protein n=1 Tax=Protopolystoma xenopodis TaxID=117903 RepID=A0A448WU90_9PLAT|nr:unnamed protein product [Protopolystoma xenopodis]